MDVEVSGYKEALSVTDKIVNAIGNDIVQIANNIVKRAKEICNDPDCVKIKINHIGFKDKEFHFDTTLSDNEAIECMKKAIQESLDNMPDGIKQMFEAEIKRLETMKK
jgi:hypothetical protein